MMETTNMKQVAIGSAVLEVARGDLTGLTVDAIVNAANVHLQHGGGVALRGPLQTGEAVMTGAGNLPAKFVIHTAGPVWGDQDESRSDALLRRAVRSSLALADEKSLKRVAVPAISTGIYRFPVDRAARLMLDEAGRYLRGRTGLERVIFCLYDEATCRVFEQALAELEPERPGESAQ
jgi:O-acetyl-ADP-ribose deacetylase (regulator of RNase III)